MRITRDVITDLFPVYQSGEASPDTRDLVEAYLLEDPEFAHLINSQQQLLPSHVQPVLPKEIEMETFEKTRKLLWQRSVYLGAALFFTLFAFAFNFSSLGVRWIWTETPVVAIVHFVVGILFWGKYAQATGKLKGSAL